MTEQKSCFVLMPFRVRQDQLSNFNDNPRHFDQVYEYIIRPAIIELNMVAERDDEDLSSRWMSQRILEKIETTDLIVCDISTHNPNVFLELGWALRADKRIVIIHDDHTERPFYLRDYFTIPYSRSLSAPHVMDNVRSLANTLRQTYRGNCRSRVLGHKGCPRFGSRTQYC